ncbi:hypothetical protein BH24ACI3_BH24ACI3_03280 [soil metagenome]
MIISSALLFVWYLQGQQTKAAEPLSADMAITKIRNKEFKEAAFKQSEVAFLDQNDAKFVTTLGSDPVRESILKEVSAINDGTANAIKVTDEPASNGFGWLLVIQLLPFLLLIGFLVFTLRQMQAGGNKA